MNQRPHKPAKKHGPFSQGNRRTPPRKPAARALPPKRLPQAEHRKVVPIDPATLAVPETTVALLAHWPDRAEELKSYFQKFIAFLLETNQLFNITGDATPEKQWKGHVEDALQNAILIEERFGPDSDIRILDVGSGGGVPGLIFALLWPDATVHLLEATGKKADFLREAARRLNLSNIDVIADRAELAARDPSRREQYDWVTARALAPLPILAEWTVPFAKPGGRVFAIKGDQLEEELKSANRAFKLLGVPRPGDKIPYTRSDGKSCHLLVYQKTAKTPSLYPRQPGVAANYPL